MAYTVEEAIEEVIRAATVRRRDELTADPHFRAPEQWLGTAVDDRTDVWALGVLLFELLTGTFPFEGRSVGELAASIVGTGPPPLRHLRPDVTPRLELMLAKSLEKDPTARYRDVAELAEDLSEYDAPIPLPRRVRIENFIAEVRNSLRPARRTAPPEDMRIPNFTPARARLAVGGRIAAGVTVAAIVTLFALFASHPQPTFKTVETIVSASARD